MTFVNLNTANRPYGTRIQSAIVPGVETPGYYQLSLRDMSGQNSSIYKYKTYFCEQHICILVINQDINNLDTIKRCNFVNDILPGNLSTYKLTNSYHISPVRDVPSITRQDIDRMTMYIQSSPVKDCSKDVPEHEKIFNHDHTSPNMDIQSECPNMKEMLLHDQTNSVKDCSVEVPEFEKMFYHDHTSPVRDVSIIAQQFTAGIAWTTQPRVPSGRPNIYSA